MIHMRSANSSTQKNYRQINKSVRSDKHINRSSHRRGAVLVLHTALHTYSLKCKPLHRQIVHKMTINMRSVNSSTQTKYWDMNQSVSTNKHIYRSSHSSGAVLVPHTALHTYSLKRKPLYRQIVLKMMMKMITVSKLTQTNYREMNKSVRSNKHLYCSSHWRGAGSIRHTAMHTYTLKCKP